MRIAILVLLGALTALGSWVHSNWGTLAYEDSFTEIWAITFSTGSKTTIKEWGREKRSSWLPGEDFIEVVSVTITSDEPNRVV